MDVEDREELMLAELEKRIAFAFVGFSRLKRHYRREADARRTAGDH